MSASDVVGVRVRELRNARGWSAQKLAEEMTAVGVPWERSIVANLENGRRRMVTVEEMLALCGIFRVSSTALLSEADVPYRCGSHNPRNIYRAGTSRDTDEHVAVAFTPEMGRLIVEALNTQRTEHTT